MYKLKKLPTPTHRCYQNVHKCRSICNYCIYTLMGHTAAQQPEALEVGGRRLETGISWVYILSPSQSADRSPTTWATAPGTHQTAHAGSHTPTGGEEGQRAVQQHTKYDHSHHTSQPEGNQHSPRQRIRGKELIQRDLEGTSAITFSKPYLQRI